MNEFLVISLLGLFRLIFISPSKLYVGELTTWLDVWTSGNTGACRLDGLYAPFGVFGEPLPGNWDFKFAFKITLVNFSHCW